MQVHAHRRSALRIFGDCVSRGAKRHFLRHLYIKTNILPRQARDKHRETQKRVITFCAGLCDHAAFAPDSCGAADFCNRRDGEEENVPSVSHFQYDSPKNDPRQAQDNTQTERKLITFKSFV